MKCRNLFLIFLTLITGIPTAIASDPTVVMIMVDGAKPKLVHYLAQKNLLPNIQKYFIQEGTWIKNSFTSASMTSPSWTSIFSGNDPDRSGVKANDTFDRETKAIENYLDLRKEIFYKEHRQRGRVLKAIHTVGKASLTDFFHYQDMTQDHPDNEIYMTFFPVNDHFPVHLFGTAIDNLAGIDLMKIIGGNSALVRFLFDFSGLGILDRDAVDTTLKVIKNQNSSKKKFIGIYFAAVDHLAHMDAGKAMRSYIETDFQIGRIMHALQNSHYNDATVVLISDHGSVGGFEPFFDDRQWDNAEYPFANETINLTFTNLNYFLTGWYNQPGYSDYSFNVESAFAAEGKYQIRNLSEIGLHPFQCTSTARIFKEDLGTCKSFHESQPELITAAVSSQEMISLPFASRTSGDWKTPNNWYTLTHYQLGTDTQGKPIIRNLIEDLENFKITNLAVYDSTLAKRIGHRPLNWLALKVSSHDFNTSVSSLQHRLASDPQEGVIVVHQSSSVQALILQNINRVTQEISYRYVPIQNFIQDSLGNITYELNNARDPFDYLGNPQAHRYSLGEFISDEDWFREFHTDREWASRYVATKFPNTVHALTKNMSFSDGMKQFESRLRADLYLNPNYGHYFSSYNTPEQANHGMYQKEAVSQLLMFRGPRIKRGAITEGPVFSKDITPTILKILNRWENIRNSSDLFEGKPIMDVSQQ